MRDAWRINLALFILKCLSVICKVDTADSHIHIHFQTVDMKVLLYNFSFDLIWMFYKCKNQYMSFWNFWSFYHKIFFNY